MVDALVRGEADDALRTRAAALGWVGDHPLVVMAGGVPAGDIEDVVDDLRRQARSLGGDALVGVQGDRLVAMIAGVNVDLAACGTALAARFGPGPVVTGPVVPGLAEAGRSARAALAGLVAVRAWPGAPRPAEADDLLPERLLSGDTAARRLLIDRAYRPLAERGGGLLETVATYLETGRSLEETARTLFVHPNTVRYRLRRVSEITGWQATDAREGFVLQVAIAAGRLAGSPARG